MYVRAVPNMTIYVPQELYDRIGRVDLNISATCQRALARKVYNLEQKASQQEFARGDGHADSIAGRAA